MLDLLAGYQLSVHYRLEPTMNSTGSSGDLPCTMLFRSYPSMRKIELWTKCRNCCDNLILCLLLSKRLLLRCSMIAVKSQLFTQRNSNLPIRPSLPRLDVLCQTPVLCKNLVANPGRPSRQVRQIRRYHLPGLATLTYLWQFGRGLKDVVQGLGGVRIRCFTNKRNAMCIQLPLNIDEPGFLQPKF